MGRQAVCALRRGARRVDDEGAPRCTTTRMPQRTRSPAATMRTRLGGQPDGRRSDRTGAVDPASPMATGPISQRVVDRPPFGPMERLDHDRLVAEQQVTLDTPRRRPGLNAPLFLIMDVVYGEARTLEKFRVLELVARCRTRRGRTLPTSRSRTPPASPGSPAECSTGCVSRWEQDNEQWHLLILEELTADAPRHPWVNGRLLPQVLAFGYYQLSWMMYSIRPAWSYRLNADFEDHAEHEYALLVAEHPSGRRRRTRRVRRRLRALREARRPVPPDRLRRAPPQVRAPPRGGAVSVVNESDRLAATS